MVVVDEVVAVVGVANVVVVAVVSVGNVVDVVVVVTGAADAL